MMRERTQLEPLPPSELMKELARSLWTGEEPAHLLPELERLVAISEFASEEWRFGMRALTTVVAARSPWRGALLAKKLLAEYPADDAGWAALGLAQSLLGNVRYALACYERALAHGGPCVSVLHNLGHLYDVAFDRPRDALPHLEQALALAAVVRSSGVRAEIAASFAHALTRAGEPKRALEVLSATLGRGRTRAQTSLVAWIEERARAAESEES
jgi:tetratricopeptide (TPR) repeat protein